MGVWVVGYLWRRVWGRLFMGFAVIQVARERAHVLFVIRHSSFVLFLMCLLFGVDFGGGRVVFCLLTK